MKLILLNGAPRSGKDTAAQFILDAFGSERKVYIERFSMPIKRAFAGMYQWDTIDHRWEAAKETVIPEIGVSYRQWQIDFSEKFMKPCYGNDIFSRLFLERYRLVERDGKDVNSFCVVPDCGFQVEYDAVVGAIEHADIALIQIVRPGYDFSKDSRNYVVAPHISPDNPSRPFTRTILNASDLDHFKTDIWHAVMSFIARTPESRPTVPPAVDFKRLAAQLDQVQAQAKNGAPQ